MKPDTNNARPCTLFLAATFLTEGMLGEAREAASGITKYLAEIIALGEKHAEDGGSADYRAVAAACGVELLIDGQGFETLHAAAVRPLGEGPADPTPEEVERWETIAQDTGKEFVRMKHTGKWCWGDKGCDHPYGPFGTRLEALKDAVDPYLENSENEEEP